MDKPQLEAYLASLDHWTLLCTLLVAIGVTGEFVVHFLYSRASSKLIDLQHAEEQHLQTQIAAANAIAAQANERALELEKQNLEIKRKMAWRTLEGEVRKVFINSIQIPTAHSVTITYYEDGESSAYADQIYSAFGSVPVWERTYGIKQVDPKSVSRGLVCYVAPNADAVIVRTITALKQANENIIVKTKDMKANAIEVVVGLRE